MLLLFEIYVLMCHRLPRPCAATTAMKNQRLRDVNDAYKLSHDKISYLFRLRLTNLEPVVLLFVEVLSPQKFNRLLFIEGSCKNMIRRVSIYNTSFRSTTLHTVALSKLENI